MPIVVLDLKGGILVESCQHFGIISFQLSTVSLTNIVWVGIAKSDIVDSFQDKKPDWWVGTHNKKCF